MKFNTIIREYINNKIAAYRGVITLTADYVATGGEIDVSKYKSLIIFPVYTKGDETTAELKITILHATGGAEHQLGSYANSSGVLTSNAYVYTLTGTQNAVPIELDITSYNLIKIYCKATGGTPTGTMKIDYLISSSN